MAIKLLIRLINTSTKSIRLKSYVSPTYATPYKADRYMNIQVIGNAYALMNAMIIHNTITNQSTIN